MTIKYHINSKGIPAICRATKGNCPFGDEDSHFYGFKAAQKAADEKNAKEFGIFKESLEEDYEYNEENQFYSSKYYRRAETEKEKEYIQKRLEEIKNKSPSNVLSSVDRCRSSEEIFVPKSDASISKHLEKERSDRMDKIIRIVGEGNIVAAFEIDHIVEQVGGKGEFKVQVAVIKSNGVMSILSKECDVEITSFIPKRNRVEVYFLRAGVIPEEDFMESSSINYHVFKGRRKFDRSTKKENGSIRLLNEINREHEIREQNKIKEEKEIKEQDKVKEQNENKEQNEIKEPDKNKGQNENKEQNKDSEQEKASNQNETNSQNNGKKKKKRRKRKSEREKMKAKALQSQNSEDKPKVNLSKIHNEKRENKERNKNVLSKPIENKEEENKSKPKVENLEKKLIEESKKTPTKKVIEEKRIIEKERAVVGSQGELRGKMSKIRGEIKKIFSIFN